MAALEQILESVHDLNPTEKRALRDYLDRDLQQQAAQSVKSSASALIGLLADEPELADQILESAMKARETRPLRMPSE